MNIYITNHWNNELNTFPKEQSDIYFTEEYVYLNSAKDNTPLCIICKDNDRITLMPFLRGHIDEYYDFETPYGYGGYISNCNDEKWTIESIRSINNYFKENNYLCGFIRYDPILRNAENSQTAVSIIYDRDTVVIDSSVCIDDIWSKQISSKNRNMIRKAEKSGLIYAIENTNSVMGEFKKLYLSTMKRIGADDYYLWNDPYFEALEKLLENNGFIATVRFDGQLVSSAIFMIYGTYGHYHLSASNIALRNNSAGNYLLWNAIKDLKERGVEKIHLGGGNSSDTQSPLLRFKASFSPYRERFYISKLIFNDEMYNSITDDWRKANPEKINEYSNRLLCYRY